MTLATIPPWYPPLTTAGELNQQRLVSKQTVTVAGDNNIIPIPFGPCQIGGNVLALDYDDGTDTYTVLVYWCWGEIDEITAVYINGAIAPTSVTENHHLGTIDQAVDATLAAAIDGFTDTMVVTNDSGTRALAYSVYQYTGDDYTGLPQFVAEVKGLKLYDARITSHVASRQWSLAAPSYDSKSFALDTQQTDPRGGSWSADGRWFVICGNNGTPATHQLRADVPFEAQTLVNDAAKDKTYAGKTLHDVEVSPCGNYVYLLDTTANQIQRQTLTTRNDTSTGTQDDTLAVNAATRGFCFTPDRKTIYTCRNDGTLQRHTLTAADVLTGATNNETLSITTECTSATGIQVSQDGLTVIVGGDAGTTPDAMHSYTLTQKELLTGASHAHTFDVSSQAGAPAGLSISPGGSKAYVIDNTTADVFQYSLDTAVDTWAYSDTPALALSCLIKDPFFGPGATVNDASVTAVADDNEEAVITGGEARRQIGLLIDAPATWETWRKNLATYASCWTYKRGADWYLASDRPRATDFTLTTSNMVPNTFSVIFGGLTSVPTVMNVTWTDTTDVVWRDRIATAYLPGVRQGDVERRDESIRLPGVQRFSQAQREAEERLAKLQQHVQIEMVLYDEHAGIEIGDVLDVTHPYGFTNALFRVIALPREAEIGRPRIRAIAYGAGDFNDTLETTDISEVTNRYIAAQQALTAADVGLGNVDNTSDATQQAATLAAATASDVGLGNVDNTSNATILAGTHTGPSSGNHTGNIQGSAAGNLANANTVDEDTIDALSTSQMETASTTSSTDLTVSVGTFYDCLSDTIDTTDKVGDTSTVLRIETTIQIEWDDTTNDVQDFEIRFLIKDTAGTPQHYAGTFRLSTVGRDDSAGGTKYEGKGVTTFSTEFGIGALAPSYSYEGVVTIVVQARAFGGGSYSPDNADATLTSVTLHLLTR